MKKFFEFIAVQDNFHVNQIKIQFLIDSYDNFYVDVSIFPHKKTDSKDYVHSSF